MPNESIGWPVAASSEISRYRLLMKIRSLFPAALSRQAATPRWTNPVPFGGCPSSYAFGSNDQISRPVSALRATTRLYGVLR